MPKLLDDVQQSTPVPKVRGTRARPSGTKEEARARIYTKRVTKVEPSASRGMRASFDVEVGKEKKKRSFRRRVVDASLLVAALLCLGLAAYQVVGDITQNAEFDSLAEAARSNGAEGGAGEDGSSGAGDGAEGYFDENGVWHEGAPDGDGSQTQVSNDGGGFSSGAAGGGSGSGSSSGGGSSSGSSNGYAAQFSSSAGGIDWNKLLATNDHTVAWMRIYNTGIDYPVVHAWEQDPDYWLHHDFWWNDHETGVPFLDYRSDSNGRNAIVYAHHLGDSGQMFSSIYGAYSQSWFDQMGDLVWSTPQRGSTIMRPLFSKIIDMGDAELQTFNFAGISDFRSWLKEFGSDATAHAANWEKMASRSTRVVICCTCARSWTGLPDRTILVYCDG